VTVRELRGPHLAGAAYGLYVPGRGAAQVTRASIAEAVGGFRGGTSDVEILLSLPGAKPVPNHPLEIVISGGDYRGLLIDRNTHLPGLVSVGSIRETVRSLERGDHPPITSRPDGSAEQTTSRLAERLSRAHDARSSANVALGVLMGLLALLALGSRSGWIARASVLAAPAMLALGLAWRSAIALFFASLVLALAFAFPRRAFVPLCVLVLGGALLVLWQWPETNSLATIGPHPDAGGRFYGVTNQVETLLLPSALVSGLVAAPLALLMIGWSRAGADGGGLIVYAAGYAMLALRAYGRVTWRRAAVAAAAVLVAGVALVALDAATGGSSHVTHALNGSLPGDIAHRLRASEQGATRSAGSFLLFSVGVVLLVGLARIRPRPVLLDAMLVAVATSLVVNDTPQDVAFWGALGSLSLLAVERTR
jgi:hypothetical protein